MRIFLGQSEKKISRFYSEVRKLRRETYLLARKLERGELVIDRVTLDNGNGRKKESGKLEATVEKAPKVKVTPEDKEAIVDLLNEGYSCKEILEVMDDKYNIYHVAGVKAELTRKQNERAISKGSSYN